MTMTSIFPPFMPPILFSTSLLACQPILGDLQVDSSSPPSGMSSSETTTSGSEAPEPGTSIGPDSTGAGSTGSTSSGSTGTGSTDPSSTGPGSTDSGSTGSGSGACSPTFVVTEYEYPTYSEADGAGAGGGELFSVSGKITPHTSHSGIMEVRARKYPGAPKPLFEARPYQVRVSGPDSDPCGPDAYYFVISNDAPTGIGTGELVFTFESNWLPDHIEKHYCVTASMMPGDEGYDDQYPTLQSWWWSEKIVVKRCE